MKLNVSLQDDIHHAPSSGDLEIFAPVLIIKEGESLAVCKAAAMFAKLGFGFV
jgi:hypothetical protein